MTVTVDDGESRDNPVTRDVTITVTGVDEKPGALAAPTVVSTDSDNTATTYELKVIWYAPDDTGDNVTGYDVEYKKTTEPSFGSDNVTIAANRGHDHRTGRRHVLPGAGAGHEQ